MICKTCQKDTMPKGFITKEILNIMKSEELCYNCAFWSKYNKHITPIKKIKNEKI